MASASRSSRPAPRRVRKGTGKDGQANAHIPTLGGARKEALQARSRETVAAILEAAACLLVEKGYRPASTNAIARRAGVSIGSLYQYFESREDIFCTLLARHTSEVHACAAQVLQPVIDGRSTVGEVLPKLLRDLLALHRDYPALTHAMTTELAHLDTEAHRRQEAKEMDEMVQHVAVRLPGPRQKALAKAWLASEITAHLTCRLAHEPPDFVETEDILAVFRELMGKLLA